MHGQIIAIRFTNSPDTGGIKSMLKLWLIVFILSLLFACRIRPVTIPENATYDEERKVYVAIAKQSEGIVTTRWDSDGLLLGQMTEKGDRVEFSFFDKRGQVLRKNVREKGKLIYIEERNEAGEFIRLKPTAFEKPIDWPETPERHKGIFGIRLGIP